MSDAEAAVLGSILFEPGILVSIRRVLSRPECFGDAKLRTVYAACLAVADRGQPIDHVTLGAELRPLLPGCDVLLADLLDQGFAPSNAPAHAGMVLDGYRRREAAAAGAELQSRAGDLSRPITTTLASLSGRLVPLVSADPLSPRRPLVKVFSEALERLEQRVRSHGQLLGPSTGFGGVDDLTDGLTTGELWVVAARPSQGKTALALHLARVVAQVGPVLMFSLEMDEEPLIERLLSAEAGASLRMARRHPEYFERNAASIARAAGTLSRLPLVIDTLARSPAMVRLTVQAEILAGRTPALVLVDYIGLMHADAEAENRNAELGRIAADLKRMARDFGIPVVALAQLNRNSVREDRAPELHDLRDSGEIEQHADVVPMIHWPTGKAERGPTAVDLYIRKERNGETGKVPLLFETWTQRFREPDQREAAA